MPWKIASVVGERWRLVQALLAKEYSLSQCCRLFGISRKTAYKWKQRFVQQGRAGLLDQVRRPHRVANRLAARWIGRIVLVRQQHRYWGPKKIWACLVRQGWRPPSQRTIARWLKRRGLIRAIRRRPAKAGVLVQPGLTRPCRPNQVWTADFKGWFRTGDGTRCEPLTVRDLFSRYGLAVQLLPNQRWQPVQRVFIGLFAQYGLPEVIRVDHGGPFASNGPASLSRLSAWWVRLGIKVELTRPAHPQDNAAHEQFHRVLKTETLMPPTWSRRGQQHRMTQWLRSYNQMRPHQALEGQVPSQWYRKSRRIFPRSLPELAYPVNRAIRRVRSNGEIRWSGRKRFIGEAFVGQRLGLRTIGPGIQAVYFAGLLIGHLHERDAGAMRPMIYRPACSDHQPKKV
jgi:putative transposase